MATAPRKKPGQLDPRRLADRLGVDPEHATAGFEDAWYYLWKEQRLPINVDVFTNHLEDPEERRRVARIFEQGLDQVVGYALPLRRKFGDEAEGYRWMSAPWLLRREHMFLIPGDSPMGFRLPLESLPWATPADIVAFHERDPFAHREPLPPRHILARGPRVEVGAAAGRGRGGSNYDADYAEPAVKVGKSFPELIRTALCAETREGRLYIFVPPQEMLEDYLSLITAIEDTAAALQMPVVLEGYPPPTDHRLNQFKVTPDPGVIEVNIHPAHSWDELVDQTTTLYEEAHQTRLGTEKFMVDGRHVGTGGGNHVVLGGATPADSPILRRPDLLRSLVAYWHNHPSLSYLFSGCSSGRRASTRDRRGRMERQPVRAGNRLPPDPRERQHPALAGGPRLPEPPGRRHGEHATGPSSASISSTVLDASAACQRLARDAGPEMLPHCADEPGAAALDRVPVACSVLARYRTTHKLAALVREPSAATTASCSLTSSRGISRT